MQAAKARGELYFTQGEMGLWPAMGRGRVEVNVTRIDDVDGTEIRDLSHAQIEGRKQCVSIMQFLRREIPGFQAAYISQVAPDVQCRETRRIVGDHVLTDEDLLEGRPFEDSIGMASYPVEVHPPETGQRVWGVPKAGLPDTLSGIAPTKHPERHCRQCPCSLGTTECRRRPADMPNTDGHRSCRRCSSGAGGRAQRHA